MKTEPEMLEKDTTQDKDTISPCGQNNIAPPQPEKKIVLVVDERPSMMEKLHELAKEAGAEPIAFPSPLPELQLDEAMVKEVEKAAKAIEDHKPTIVELFPHVQRKKTHPHKRSIDPIQRAALRAEGKAWWIRGGNSVLASLLRPNKAEQGGSIPQAPSSEVANG